MVKEIAQVGIVEHKFKSKITGKLKQIITEKTLYITRKMPFTHFLAISTMSNMYAKLLCHFTKESIYTEGLNLDASMLSNILKMFPLVHLCQFKSLSLFLVLA